jgi:AAA+ ATPase superfamily predicted ATPase
MEAPKKLLIVGERLTGKTSLIQAFKENDQGSSLLTDYSSNVFIYLYIFILIRFKLFCCSFISLFYNIIIILYRLFNKDIPFCSKKS